MKRLSLILILSVLAAACTGSDGTDTTAETTALASSTEATTTTAAVTMTTGYPLTTVAPATTVVTTTTPLSTTTTALPSTTTTTAATTTTSGGPYLVGTPGLYPLSPLPGSDGAGGSGCSPGAGPLPDGVWFGYVYDQGTASVEFDLACFYFGDIAYTKGAEDGEEVDDDYYVRNHNATTRTVPVEPTATVYEIDATTIDFVPVPFSAWPLDPTGYIACPSDWCGVWLFINGGVTTEILEQYTP